MNLLVEDQPGPGAFRGGGRADRGPVLRVPGDQRDVHLPGPEHPHRLRQLGLGQQQVDPGVPGGQPGQRGGNDGRQRGGKYRQPDAFLPLLDVCGQFPLGGVQPPRISSARPASRRPASVSLMPRPERWVSRAPVSASSRARWWLTEGWA